MKQLSINVEKREGVGRHEANRIRRAGRVPAVVYGKSGTQSLSLDEKELRALLKANGQSVALVSIKVGGKESILTLISGVQRDSIKDHLVHVDFHEVSKTDKMKISIPLVVKGEAFGVKNENAILDVSKHSLSIKCLPVDMPESIVVDISELKAGGRIHVKDLAPIKGVEFCDDKEVVVVSCDTAEEEVVEEEVSPESASPAKAVPVAAPAAVPAKGKKTSA